MPSPILANMCLHVGERRQADERRALAAHLGEGAGLVAVVQRHEVAADAGAGETAVGQLGRRARAGSRRRTPGRAAAARPAAPAYGGAGGSGRFRPADARNRARPAATLSGDSSISGDSSGAPRGIGLAADLRPLVGGQMIQRVADLRLRRSRAFPRPPGWRACRGRTRAAPRSPAARSCRPCRPRVCGWPSRPSRRSACIVSSCALPTVIEADRRVVGCR